MSTELPPYRARQMTPGLFNPATTGLSPTLAKTACSPARWRADAGQL